MDKFKFVCYNRHTFKKRGEYMETAVNSTEEIIRRDMSAIIQCHSKETLLMTIWNINKHQTQQNSQIQALISQKLDELHQEQLMYSKDRIIQKLVNPINRLSRNYITILAQEEKLEPWELEEILRIEQQNHQEDPNFKTYVTLLEKLEERVHQYVGDYTEIDIRNKEQMEIARLTCSMYINSPFTTLEAFCASTGCTEEEFTMSLELLASHNDILYEQYQQKGSIDSNISQESTISSEPSTEFNNYEHILTALLDKSEKGLVSFCNEHSLNVPLVKLFIKDNREQNALILAKGTPEERQQALSLFQQKYGRLVQSAAKEMYGILKIEYKNKKHNDNQPVPLFDLYHFCEQSDLPFYQVMEFVNTLGDRYPITNSRGEEISSKKIMRKFVFSHDNIFGEIKTATIMGLKHTQVMSCNGHVIHFQPNDVDNALKDIEDKNLLYYRGLVFQAIEQQKKLREAKNNQAPDMQAKVYQKKQ